MGINASNLVRKFRAKTGAPPPVDMAISTGDRSMIDGVMKLHSSGWSTTLTGVLFACASDETRSLTSGKFVAAVINR